MAKIKGTEWKVIFSSQKDGSFTIGGLATKTCGKNMFFLNLAFFFFPLWGIFLLLYLLDERLFFFFSIITNPEVADYYCRITLSNKVTSEEVKQCSKECQRVKNVKMSSMSSG